MPRYLYVNNLDGKGWRHLHDQSLVQFTGIKLDETAVKALREAYFENQKIEREKKKPKPTPPNQLTLF